MEKKNAVTIKDVAERAGVAISTVSRVLNNLDRVSDETRNKVKKATEELGFVKNSFAASLKNGNTQMVIVVVPDIINECYTAIIQGVEEVAAARGYCTLVFATEEDKEKERELFAGKVSKIIEGVILFPANDDIEFLCSIEKPVVFVDRCIIGNDRPSVVIDNYKGSYLATERLIKSGHKKIGLLIGSVTFNIGHERMRGFRQAMSDYGIEVQEQYLKYTTWYQEDGYRCTRELMEMECPPTAIYASNNLLCMGCIEALNDMKIRIGKDISVIGFDDTILARRMDPGITVISRETTEMGRLGAVKLFDILENRQSELEKHVVLDVELVERNSVVDIR